MYALIPIGIGLLLYLIGIYGMKRSIDLKSYRKYSAFRIFGLGVCSSGVGSFLVYIVSDVIFK